jgi:hypothetical protein
MAHTHDDTARLQAMIDAGEQVPPGEYRLTRPLELIAGTVLRGCTFTLVEEHPSG